MFSLNHTIAIHVPNLIAILRAAGAIPGAGPHDSITVSGEAEDCCESCFTNTEIPVSGITLTWTTTHAHKADRGAP